MSDELSEDQGTTQTTELSDKSVEKIADALKDKSPAEQQEAQRKDLHDKLGKIWDKSAKEREAVEEDKEPPKDVKRNERGQFKSTKADASIAEKEAGAVKALNAGAEKEQTTDKAADKAKAAPQGGKAPPEKQTEAAPKHAEAPKSWPAEKKAVWDKLDPEAREYLAARDKEQSQKFAQLSNIAHQAKQLEPVRQILESNKAYFDQFKMPFDEGVHRLIEAHKQLIHNPARMIMELARDHNVDIVGLAQHLSGQQMGSADPEIQQLRNENAQLRQRQQQIEQHLSQQHIHQQQTQRQRSEAEYNSHLQQINEFAKDKPDFDKVLPLVSAQLQVLHSQRPTATLAELLPEAWEAASWAHPETRMARQEKAEKDRLAQAAKEGEEAKRAASLNVNGNGSLAAGNLWDTKDGRRKALGAVFDKSASR